ncbi:MAG: Rpn family recombination-promoting nuclease/putative transposase [Treponema sp.]|jgi:predicted transposase/invertase (TIGR01784 family)|nr:Rpn family recombination-promoting nuclease/putative transposase [Treponema sp.]
MKTIQLTTETLLDPRIDPVFKAVFTKDTPSSRGALRSLLSAYLHQELDILAVIANEPPVHHKDGRQIRYDIACVFTTGEKADVEMTLFPGKFEARRMEYYLARLHCSQKLKGDPDYEGIKRSYQISFLGGNLFKDAAILHSFEYHDREHDVPLDGRTKLLVVELKKTERLSGEALERLSVEERWALFFQSASDPGKLGLVNRLLESEEGIAMAGETMIEITPEEKAYFLQMSRDKYKFDEWSRKRELWEKDQELAKKDQELVEKDQELTEVRQKLAEARRQAAEKDQKLVKKDQTLAEKDREIAELRRLLGS